MTNTATCHICAAPLRVSLAPGRKTGKPFIRIRCSTTGRHFRVFIADQTYVRDLLDRLNLEG